MKHPVPVPVPVGLDRTFAHELIELGLRVGAEHQDWLLQYLLLLLEANKRINLTSITDPEVAVRLHLVDSLASLPELADAPIGSLLDIGSGGGLPGIPLATVSGRSGVLLDSVAKKVAAVASVLQSLPSPGTTIEVRAERAEGIGASGKARFAAVVARAVAPLPSLVELAAPLLLDGGTLIALKGTPAESEFRSGSKAAKLVGLEESARRQLRLPGGGEARTIVVYRKTHSSSIDLPRRTGLAQNSPLA